MTDVRACASRVQAPVQRPGPATPGLYRKAGQILRVSAQKATGRLQLHRAEVDTTDGVTQVSWLRRPDTQLARLTLADRMDPGEVRAFGVLTTVCLMCGIRLEHPDSVARGIGPICARKL